MKVNNKELAERFAERVRGSCPQMLSVRDTYDFDCQWHIDDRYYIISFVAYHAEHAPLDEDVVAYRDGWIVCERISEKDAMLAKHGIDRDDMLLDRLWKKFTETVQPNEAETIRNAPVGGYNSGCF